MMKVLVAWLALAVLVFPVGGADDLPDDAGAGFVCPEQYFSCDWRDASCDGRAADYWETLFPENPPFTYACLYLGSFDHEFGFYLKGCDLYWAQSTGFQSRQMLSQKPIVDLQTMEVFFCARAFLCLTAPVTSIFLDGWDWFAEKGPGVFLGREKGGWAVPCFYTAVCRAAAFAESVVNPFLYSRLFVRRGRRALNPVLASALRKTWDEAVAERTFAMKKYRDFLQVLDGSYCYFRGSSGPVGEDLCRHGGKMKSSMMVLARGLIDMMMMDDFSPEREKWLLKQCSVVCRNARQVGSAPPPMVSDDWTDEFIRRYCDDGLREQGGRRGMGSDALASLPVPMEEARGGSGRDERRYVEEYKRRFLRPLEDNSLWRDLFPKGAEGATAALWFGERGVTGVYLKGKEMGRAAALSIHPLAMFERHVFLGEDERILGPYDGGMEGSAVPRIKREWMFLGNDLSRLATVVLNHIVCEERPGGKVAEEAGNEGIGFVVIRGEDGKTRVITPQGKEFHAVVRLLEAIYDVSACADEGEGIRELLSLYDSWQGKKSRKKSGPGKKGYGINGCRFEW